MRLFFVCMNKYYHALKEPSTLSKLLEKYTTIEYHKHYFNIGGYPVIQVDKDDILSDPSMYMIHREYPFDAYVMRLDPYINYTWHIDEWRGVTINQLLKHTNSHCFFGEQNSKWVMNLVEVPYNPDTFYIFDTQSKHCIINLENYRYILTLDFYKKKTELTYNQLYEYCESVDLI